MSVGFVGTGAMGLPMARNVLARTPVVAYDPDTERAALLSRTGACAARSPRAVAAAADLVIVMVATAAQLDDALFGEQGAAAGRPERAGVRP